LAGCFSWIRALLAPVVIFGRNIPLAALLPLTFFFFGIGEWQKVMFIFVACVAFVIADVTVAVSEISSRYLDTAYTLGANSWQSIIKVLVPLAMPAILDSARLLFGLAFGYIMLAELIRFGEDAGGLGNLILVAQRRGPREHIYLIILIIPIVALAIDRVLYLVQVQLCPFRYGGAGWLHRGVRVLLHVWDDLKSKVLPPKPPFDQFVTATASAPTTPAEPQP
jgi:ABC-type nitrate/sulfonate/bicarbonate transport system permease component